MSRLRIIAAALAMAGGIQGASAALITTSNNNATALANALAGSGITISNASLSGTNTTLGVGLFSAGNTVSLGIDAGVLLTTGDLSCAPGPNSSEFCTGDGAVSQLSFNFVSQTGQLFFQYVFASEEYNEFVGSGFNDSFQLLLNGTNIALLPGGGGPVTVNNVNCGSNASFYRNNSSVGASTACPNSNLNIQYDGLTTVLTASANVVAGATNTFTFRVADVGDSQYDSGVFIAQGSFSGTNPNPVPAPGSLLLLGIGALAAASLKRARR
jgi:hypothetical protein